MKYINKLQLRKIKINGQVFLWKRGHYHLEEFKHSKCAEKVIIYLKDYKNAPIHLLFREEDNLTNKATIEKEKWCVGYPDAGVIWLYKYNSVSPITINEEQLKTININLNRPAVIETFIKFFFDKIWKPKEQNKPLIIENALKYLDIIKLPNGMN